MTEKTDDKNVDVYIKYNVYRPSEGKLKKYPCKDCFSCLFCSDARCQICLKTPNKDSSES